MSAESSRSSPELLRLISELIDGRLGQTDGRHLNDLLRDDPAAQDVYYHLISVHGLLHLDFGQGCQHLLPPVIGTQPTLARNTAATSNPVTPVTKWPRVLLAAIVATAAGLILLSVKTQLRTDPPVAPQSEIASDNNSGRPPAPKVDHFARTEPHAVAILSQTTGVVWTDRSLPTDIGAPLLAGEFHMEQGLIQIELFSGASAVIEAPAHFELISPTRIMCRRGRIRASVPRHAHGFTIETPNYTAVDLGTEFTVQVDGLGQSEFHVVDGEIELWDRRRDINKPAETLSAGQGVRASLQGLLTTILSDESSFVDGRELLEIAEVAHQTRYDRWQLACKELRSAPNVVVFYTFDDHARWERVLRNESVNGNTILDGAIVGCQWTTGRWRNKQALEFKRPGDRVRINVPGEFESLTFATWVRIEGFERWLSSLMMSEGHDQSEVHWQLTEDGQIMLGVKAETNRSHDYYSPPVIKPSSLGRWVHLATVFNGDVGYVSHYLDGVEVSREEVRKSTVLRIGGAELGNWVPQDFRSHRIRSLNGRMDEFILFNEPLTEKMIREIYEMGKTSGVLSAATDQLEYLQAPSATGRSAGLRMGQKPPVYLHEGQEVRLDVDKLGIQRH